MGEQISQPKKMTSGWVWVEAVLPDLLNGAFSEEFETSFEAW